MYQSYETPGVNLAIMGPFEHTCAGEHHVRLALRNRSRWETTLHEFCPGRIIERGSADVSYDRGDVIRNGTSGGSEGMMVYV